MGGPLHGDRVLVVGVLWMVVSTQSCTQGTRPNHGGVNMNKNASGKSRSFRQVLLLVVFILLCVGRIGTAQERRGAIDEVVKELIKFSLEKDRQSVIFWFPVEFFIASAPPNVPLEQTKQVEEALEPYLIIAVANGKRGVFGGTTFDSEADIRASLRVKDSAGTSYSPLDANDIGPDMRNLFATMKPGFARSAGELGEHSHFFAFPSKGKEGQIIAAATKEGTFSVELGETTFRWRLPLGTLVPPKICPVDGEQLSGAWKFCPWHGAELKVSSQGNR